MGFLPAHLPPHSLSPVLRRVTLLLREPPCPQPEAIFSKGLVITLFKKGGRKKHSQTLRTGAGSGSSDQTGYNDKFPFRDGYSR